MNCDLVIWTQPSGPLCLWQCFIYLSRAKHGVGQCCVDIRAILQAHCPNIKTFSGLSLRESSGRIKSKQQVRRLLHKDYLANGGALDLDQWSRGYWHGRNLTMAHHGFPYLFNLCAMMWDNGIDIWVKVDIINGTIAPLHCTSQVRKICEEILQPNKWSTIIISKLEWLNLS